MTDAVRMRDFVDSLTEKIEKDQVNDIPSSELRLGRKLVEAQDAAKKTVEDIQRTQETIQQAHQRVESLQRQHLELSAKATGIIESLIMLKFGDELDEEKEAKSKKVASKGNGAKDPSKPKRSKKKKRTTRAAKRPTARRSS